jgi:hypothetical protein
LKLVLLELAWLLLAEVLLLELVGHRLLVPVLRRDLVLKGKLGLRRDLVLKGKLGLRRDIVLRRKLGLRPALMRRQGFYQI